MVSLMLLRLLLLLVIMQTNECGVGSSVVGDVLRCSEDGDESVGSDDIEVDDKACDADKSRLGIQWRGC
ncbi:Hypothetical predicted protein [Octopus vulgaris]|uniref:Secreted protein n=1 Tax=Octopus vulgaris TaxID=6645 RepID=A0AA36BX28_OCTVU|nr:Hypothetical predicted protein [Octopus vulgaris]